MSSSFSKTPRKDGGHGILNMNKQLLKLSLPKKFVSNIGYSLGSKQVNFIRQLYTWKSQT